MSDENDQRLQPNYKVECENCGQKPTVDDMGLCGPCCFGESDCIDPKNW